MNYNWLLDLQHSIPSTIIKTLTSYHSSESTPGSETPGTFIYSDQQQKEIIQMCKGREENSCLLQKLHLPAVSSLPRVKSSWDTQIILPATCRKSQKPRTVREQGIKGKEPVLTFERIQLAERLESSSSPGLYITKIEHGQIPPYHQEKRSLYKWPVNQGF